MGIFTKKVERSVNTEQRFNKKNKKVYWIVSAIFIIGLASAFLDFPVVWDKGADWLNQKTGSEVFPHFFQVSFKLGLDLRGGTHLVYEADLSNVAPEDYVDSMQGVRDVIERRVNMFGVSEPVVQINKVGSHHRLIVELAGISDVHQAIEMIGKTPFLDFREERDIAETENILSDQEQARQKLTDGLPITQYEEGVLFEDPYFKPTELTGRYLKGAQVYVDQQTYQNQISLEFDSEGAKLFEEVTKRNINKRLAIFLDGVAISAPVVQGVISGGKAQITGNFTSLEAKELVQRLNAGALPVPINLINQQTIGASLGLVSLEKSLSAGIWGFLIVLLFIVIYYRLPGLIASLALLIYVVLVLAVFKIASVTLTLAGIAGFILSIGMAVDANVLIFERLREELKTGKSLAGSIDEGFKRAWPAVRDGSVSTIITCVILFIFATGLIKGFALTLGIGVLISLFSAFIITKNFLRLFVGNRIENWKGLW
ncbi:MAG: protein translocase subunit SecD [bacterium]